MNVYICLWLFLNAFVCLNSHYPVAFPPSITYDRRPQLFGPRYRFRSLRRHPFLLDSTISLLQPFKCDSILPGIDRMSRGVDITKLDLLPAKSKKSTGLVRRVIDLTCKDSETWTNPFNDQIYTLPDQVNAINPLPYSVIDANVNVYSTAEEVKRSMSSTIGQAYTEGMFSESSSFVRDQHLISNSSVKIVEVEAFFSSVEADFLTHEELGASLSQAARSFIENQLPDKYETDPSKFFEFFQKFGTHYFSTARFGGLFRITITLSNVFRNVTDHYLQEQARNTFLNKLRRAGVKGVRQTKVDKKFLKAAKVTKRYFGGNTNLFDSNDLKNWWNTVPGNPWLFGGKLESITKLIAKNKKSDAINLAYEVYLGKAYAIELQRDLYSFIGKGLKAEKEAVKYFAKISNLLNEDEIDYKEMRELGAKIRHFLYPPDWFTSKTRLCYQFYADGDEGQCSASGQELCANINAMTEPYEDLTDSREGGCVMRWKIDSPLSDEWFKKVQLCFTHYPEGDEAQCSPDSPSVSCAVVNKFTHPYKDDTDGRHGGCLLAWALIVPNNSPGWLLNSKLCFRWQPTNQQTETCSAEQNDGCVAVNSYTHFYKDNSDERGGCRLSWGIQTMNFKN